MCIGAIFSPSENKASVYLEMYSYCEHLRANPVAFLPLHPYLATDIQ